MISDHPLYGDTRKGPETGFDLLVQESSDGAAYPVGPALTSITGGWLAEDWSGGTGGTDETEAGTAGALVAGTVEVEVEVVEP